MSDEELDGRPNLLLARSALRRIALCDRLVCYSTSGNDRVPDSRRSPEVAGAYGLGVACFAFASSIPTRMGVDKQAGLAEGRKWCYHCSEPLACVLASKQKATASLQ